MKKYINFINEKKVNKIDLNIIYAKYYTDIDQKDFIEIIESDPTSTIDNKLYMGKYSKWLVNLYRNNNLKIEDLYKATEYLELFDKQSVRNKISKQNINDYNSLSDLAKIVLPFKETDEIKSRSEIKDDNFIHEFKHYNLYIPRTFKDSCILGKGTEWCTATEKTDEYFKQYHKPGRELLIFIDKNDVKIKCQLHLRSKQFMDIYDDQQDLGEWIDEDNKDIEIWLKENYGKEYKKYFNDGDIYWNKNTLEGAPEIVEGDFYCDYNELTTLEGGPKIVEGNFYCSNNNLISLEGGPEIVEGDFYCDYNELTTLEGGPKIVEGNFYCSNNNLISLEGAPKIVEGRFDCFDNKLTSLKGAPEKVEGGFDCNDNKLTSLEGAPKTVEGDFNCKYNIDLPKEEIERYRKTGSVKGKIIS